jgi:ribosomal protein S4
MLYPAYQLNPGDMFQVDPDRVLFATGKPKKKVQARKSGGATESDLAEEEQAEEDAEGEGEAAEAESPETVAGEEIKDPKEVLTSLLYQAKDVLAGDTDASAKRKRALRAFQKTVRRTLSRKNSQTAAMEDLESQFAELTSKLNISVAEPASTNPEDKQTPSTETRTITSFQKKQIEQALAVMRENPVDPSKPYATPWMPRPFMSAFAFIPRYLEVQHSICSAVYLRHPVVRPGLAEVPTPFNSEVLGLAFNWYLKRR